MSDLYWLTDEQMARLQRRFSKSHGNPRVDDRRVVSGIVFAIVAGCAGVMRRRTMGRTRHSTIAGSGGRGGCLLAHDGGARGSGSRTKTFVIDATPAFAGAGST